MADWDHASGCRSSTKREAASRRSCTPPRSMVSASSPHTSRTSASTRWESHRSRQNDPLPWQLNRRPNPLCVGHRDGAPSSSPAPAMAPTEPPGSSLVRACQPSRSTATVHKTSASGRSMTSLEGKRLRSSLPTLRPEEFMSMRSSVSCTSIHLMRTRRMSTAPVAQLALEHGAPSCRSSIQRSSNSSTR